MGSFKPLLPLAGQTVIQRIIALFQDAGLEDVRVVLGHRADELRPVIEQCGAMPLVNPDYEQDMFSSVLVGIESMEPDTDAFFILPADVLLVRPATLATLILANRQNPDSVIYPCFKGERGHPPLIPTRYAQTIVDWRGQGGLRAALNQTGISALEIEVPDRHILFDMDTPDDYDQALARWREYPVPALDECEAIMTYVQKADSDLIAHSEAVCELAMFLALKLNQAGADINVALVERAALVHDLAKGQPRHDIEGGRLLKKWGFPLAAEIVEKHIDLDLTDRNRVDEAELVHVSDKLVQGSRMVSLEMRFEKGFSRFGHDSEIRSNIERRLRNTEEIKRRVERMLGRPVETLVKGEVEAFNTLALVSNDR